MGLTPIDDSDVLFVSTMPKTEKTVLAIVQRRPLQVCGSFDKKIQVNGSLIKPLP